MINYDKNKNYNYNKEKNFLKEKKREKKKILITDIINLFSEKNAFVGISLQLYYKDNSVIFKTGLAFFIFYYKIKKQINKTTLYYH